MGNINTTTAIITDTATVSTTALSLTDFTNITAAHVQAASRLWLTVNSESIRYRYDGTAVTSSTGHLVTNTTSMMTLIGGTNIAQLSIIRGASADAEVCVTLEG